MAELTDTDIRERVRERYAAAATAVAESTGSGCCGAPAAIAGCGPDIASTDEHGNEVFGAGALRRRPRARPQGRSWRPRSAAACRPRSPICMTARPCSTSAPAPAPTC